MNQALFESLTGTFLDGTHVDSIPENKRLMHSIMDHLNRMFNTRTGSIPHLKDYGLPDISEIYRKGSEGIDELREAIKRTVEKYEPRLKNVRVARKEEAVQDFRLEFILSGEFRRGGLVRFQTTFISTGLSKISPWKKPQ
jgi:type VI secretion system protein